MSGAIRIAHYVNQFFGGIGGEDKAYAALELRDRPAGIGAAIQREIKGAGTIVLTLVCGDNAFNDRPEEILEAIAAALRERAVDLVIAGPAFDSGRYGIAAARVCSRAEDLGIPTVVGLHPESPGRKMTGRSTFVVPTPRTAAGAGEAVARIGALVRRLAAGDEVYPERDGYLPRFREPVMLGRPAAARAVEMLLRKRRGEPYMSEIPIRIAEPVPAPPPVADLARATVAIVTEAGMVPPGNPDRIEQMRATKWRRYSIEGKEDLVEGDFVSIHGGYDNTWVNRDPDRMLPVDVLREFERDGVIGRLDPFVYSTCGSVGSIEVMQALAADMARALSAADVGAVVLSAT